MFARNLFAISAIITIVIPLCTTVIIAGGGTAEAGQSISGKTIYTRRGTATYHSNGEFTWTPKGRATYKGKWTQTGSTVCTTLQGSGQRCTTYDFKTQTGTNKWGSFRFWY